MAKPKDEAKPLDLTYQQATDYKQALTDCLKPSEAISILGKAQLDLRLNSRVEWRRKYDMDSHRNYLKDLRARGLVNYMALYEAFKERMKGLLYGRDSVSGSDG